MSNKEILQQNNSRLNVNNVDLISILDTINNLPENVEIKLQEKSITPTTTQQEVVADGGYTGLAKVTVEKITGENLNVVPSSQQQNFNGVYTNVTVEGIVPTTDLKITDASYLFYEGARTDYVNELLELCENLTNMRYMFNYCSKLITLDLSKINTSNVTSMQSMFYYCSNLTELDISNFDTSKVTNMQNMFNGCSKLTSLDISNFNTSNVTAMDSMFYSCNSLNELDVSNFDMSKVTNARYMFNGCRNVKTLDLSKTDMGNVNNVNCMFDWCVSLTNLKGFKDLGKKYTQKTNNYSNYKLDLSACSNLTYESLMNVINNLYDLNLTYNVANGGTLYTQTLNLGSTNKKKLTSEEIAIATAKGFNVT